MSSVSALEQLCAAACTTGLDEGPPSSSAAVQASQIQVLELDAFSSVHDLIHSAIATNRGAASLKEVYDVCQQNGRIAYKRAGGSRLITSNDHWKSQIRHALYTSDRFERVSGSSDLWRVTPAYQDARPQLVKVLVRADEVAGAVPSPGSPAAHNLQPSTRSPGTAARGAPGRRGRNAPEPAAGVGPRAVPSTRREGQMGRGQGPSRGRGRGTKSRSATPEAAEGEASVPRSGRSSKRRSSSSILEALIEAEGEAEEQEEGVGKVAAMRQAELVQPARRRGRKVGRHSSPPEGSWREAGGQAGLLSPQTAGVRGGREMAGVYSPQQQRWQQAGAGPVGVAGAEGAVDVHTVRVNHHPSHHLHHQQQLRQQKHPLNSHGQQQGRSRWQAAQEPRNERGAHAGRSPVPRPSAPGRSSTPEVGPHPVASDPSSGRSSSAAAEPPQPTTNTPRGRAASHHPLSARSPLSAARPTSVSPSSPSPTRRDTQPGPPGLRSGHAPRRSPMPACNCSPASTPLSDSSARRSLRSPFASSADAGAETPLLRWGATGRRTAAHPPSCESLQGRRSPSLQNPLGGSITAQTALVSKRAAASAEAESPPLAAAKYYGGGRGTGREAAVKPEAGLASQPALLAAALGLTPPSAYTPAHYERPPTIPELHPSPLHTPLAPHMLEGWPLSAMRGLHHAAAQQLGGMGVPGGIPGLMLSPHSAGPAMPGIGPVPFPSLIPSFLPANPTLMMAAAANPFFGPHLVQQHFQQQQILHAAQQALQAQRAQEDPMRTLSHAQPAVAPSYLGRQQQQQRGRSEGGPPQPEGPQGPTSLPPQDLKHHCES